MLLELEGRGVQECILAGEGCTVRELFWHVRQTLAVCERESFVRIFCHQHNFQEFPLDPDVRVDCVLDIDIPKLYKPCYGDDYHEVLPD